jgi:hypothetical protein
MQTFFIAWLPQFYIGVQMMLVHGVMTPQVSRSPIAVYPYLTYRQPAISQWRQLRGAM